MDPLVIVFALEHGLSPEDAEAVGNIVDETGVSLEEAWNAWKTD
jgi:hypothetical protein